MVIVGLFISAKTTLEDMTKLCPLTQPYDIGDGKIAVAVNLCVGCDAKVIFIFKNGQLIEFQYYMPC